MRICYLGNFRPSWSTENHIRLTLQDLGHTVVRVQEDECRLGPLRDEIAAGTFDLVLYTKTWGLPEGNQAGVEFFRWCRGRVPTVSYHLDLYFGLNREAGMAGDPFWATEFSFTPDGGSQERFEAMGINHHYMPPAVYREETGLGHADARYGTADIIFVGSYQQYHHREWPYRRQLIDWLKTRYGGNFRLYGADTSVIRGRALNDLYATAKLVVGDSLCLGFNHPLYWSDRIYETVGRGGFLIHPYVPGIEEHFTDGFHCVFYQYGDFDGLEGAIKFWLDQPERRKLIRQAGVTHVYEHHTYHNRMERMLEIVGC